MHCPTCGYEYEAWARVCPDCGGALAPGPPPTAAPPPPDIADYGRFRDWTVVTNVPNTFMGNLLKAQLEQAGIPVLMKRSRVSDIAEWSHNDFVMHDLYVPFLYMGRARELIASPPSGAIHTGPGAHEWAGEDAEAPDTDSGETPAAAAPGSGSGWYLVDSGTPFPGPAGALAGSGLPPASAGLPGLRLHQQALDARKHHRVGGPAEERGQILPFRPPDADPSYADPDMDDEEPAGGGITNWTQSRVYRILMGLLLLAWVLPILLQMLAGMGETFGRLFR